MRISDWSSDVCSSDLWATWSSTARRRRSSRIRRSSRPRITLPAGLDEPPRGIRDSGLGIRKSGMPYRPEPDHREIPGRPRFPESPIPNPQSRFRAMTTQPHSHIVKSRDEERNRVINEILRMGSMAAAQLEAALDVLERRDDKAAERIIGNAEEIDKLERQDRKS